MGRALALPAKGQSGRGVAVVAWGTLAATVFGTLAYASFRPEPAAERKDPARKRAPNSSAFVPEPRAGYGYTYLDGSGGIAGVPLTDEQRWALVREAIRRGLPIAEAYALAYGDQADITVRPDGEVEVGTGQVVVPNGPVYMKVPPGFAGASAPPAGGSGESQSEGGQNGKGKGQSEGKGKDGNGKGQGGSEKGKEKPYCPDTGENPYEEPDSVLPPLLDDLADKVAEVSEWLAMATPAEPEVIGPVVRGNKAVVEVEAPIGGDLAVVTTITAPLDGASTSEPVVTSLVTDMDTGEVVARHEPERCHNVDEVPGVAIGQIVDVVIEAKQEADLESSVLE